MADVAPHNQLLDQELFSLCSAAVADGLRYVELCRTNGDIAQHRDWPKLEWRDNGMPRFTVAFGEAPLNYGDALGSLRSKLRSLYASEDRPPEAVFEEEPAFRNLIAYIRGNERLAKHFVVEFPSFTVGVQLTIGAFVDRYIHTYDTVDFDPEKFLPIYVPLERFWLIDPLEVAILVPILFLKFEASSQDLGGGALVKELGPALQLARAPRERFGHNPLVEECSTHAFMLTNYSIPNASWLSVAHLAGDPKAYPVNAINALFGALRIVTGHTTGYAQLLLVPIGWASDYNADISRLSGAVVRCYPARFEDGGWDQEIAIVALPESQKVGNLFGQLQALTKGNKNPQLALAVERLNSASLRTTDEDGIVDAVIGLEALLSEDNQEMTHKIALRMAALSKLEPRQRNSWVSSGSGSFPSE